MNRRDLLKAIALLPPLKSIEVAKLDPNEVIVVTSQRHLSDTDVATIRAVILDIWPGRKVLVIDAGLSMQVVKG